MNQPQPGEVRGMKSIRTRIAKELLPHGFTGNAIDEIVEVVEKDIADPVFQITPMDVAKMVVRYRPEREDAVIFVGRRDWQFRKDGSKIGAGFGLCCGF
jgi:hypothetical protein